MFKSIPGNNDYRISLLHETVDKDNKIVQLPVSQDGRLEIELYGKKVHVHSIWLSLLAHFEIELPEPSARKLENVVFRNTNPSVTRSPSGKIVVFKKPFMFKHQNKIYRIIPGYVRYAISYDGSVIEIDSMSDVNPTYVRGRHVQTDTYPSVYIYYPERMFYKYVYIHRLVALAWIPNFDYEEAPIVNHKDGNKVNFHGKNLEWCSYSHNSLHAIETGLRSDNSECMVRNYKTGVVKSFSSLSQASMYMGLTYILREEAFYDIKSRLINDTYEIKLKEDTTPWFYEGRTEKVKIGRYIVISEKNDGTIQYFYDLRDFKREFGVWNCSNIHDLLKKAAYDHPDYKFNYQDNYHDKPIQAFNISTKEILETKTIVEMSEKLKISEHVIRRGLRKGEEFSKTGYAFRYKSENPWAKVIHESKRIEFKVKAVNRTTGEILTFTSLRKAAKYLKHDRGAIKYSLKNAIPLPNWVIYHDV